MGKTVPDNEYGSILMGSLLLSYQATLSTISVAAKMSSTTPTPEIITKLATAEFNRHTLKEGKASDKAFVADAHKKGKKHEVKCFNCHKKGHVKADCWEQGGGKEGQGLKRHGGRVKDSNTKGDAATSAEQAGEKKSMSRN